MFKFIFTVIFLLFTTNIFASTPGELIGISSNGYRFSLNFDGADVKEENGNEIWTPYISFQKINGKNEIIKNTYVTLPKICIAKQKIGSWGFHTLICSKDSNSPLNNVSYKLNIEKFNKTEIQTLICKTGCNNTVPKDLTHTGG